MGLILSCERCIPFFWVWGLKNWVCKVINGQGLEVKRICIKVWVSWVMVHQGEGR